MLINDVTGLYRYYLNREPDSGGLAFWKASTGQSVSATEAASFGAASLPERTVSGYTPTGEITFSAASAIEDAAKDYHAAVAADNAAQGTLATRQVIYDAGRRFRAAVAANGGGYAGVEFDMYRPDLVQAHWDRAGGDTNNVLVSQEIQSSWTSTFRPLLKVAAIAAAAYVAAPYLMEAAELSTSQIAVVDGVSNLSSVNTIKNFTEGENAMGIMSDVNWNILSDGGSSGGSSGGSIFDSVTGTIADIGKTVVGVYTTVAGVQMSQAQIDLAKAQTQATIDAAKRAATTPSYSAVAGSGFDWKMIALGAAALVGAFFVFKKM